VEVEVVVVEEEEEAEVVEAVMGQKQGLWVAPAPPCPHCPTRT
jgi:hypothetical protein